MIETLERESLESPERALSVATSVAQYYGFSTVANLPVGTGGKKPSVRTRAADRELDGVGGDLAAGFAAYTSAGAPAPSAGAAQFYTNEFKKDKDRRRDATFMFGLHVAGSQKSIAEAVVIRTTLTVLQELGFKDLVVHINSIGDKDSVTRFTRELGNFFKRRAPELSPQLAALARTDVWNALETIYEKELPLAENAPRSLDYLSEASRRHFREVLTYLDSMGVQYVLDERILGRRECYSQVLFRITRSSGEELTTLAEGGRYDQLAKNVFQLAVPAVGSLLSFLVSGMPRARMPETREKKPRFFFIQLGFEAKLASFPLLEQLRHARIPVKTSLSLDDLHTQLELASAAKVPYVIIVGHKEAHEGTALVRTLATHSQQNVRLSELPAYLKNLP